MSIIKAIIRFLLKVLLTPFRYYNNRRNGIATSEVKHELPNDAFLGLVSEKLAEGHTAVIWVKGYIMRPFIEFGIQGNYAKAKMFDAVVGDKNFTMLDPYMGGNYYPGAQAYDVTYGGWGFGFSGSAGLKIVVAKGVSLDPTFYFALQRLAIYQTKNGPEEYRMGNRFTPNYGVLLRVTMNDFFFSRNK